MADDGPSGRDRAARSAARASGSDPSPLQRRATSLVMQTLGSTRLRSLRRRGHEWRRRLTRRGHRVEVFHQVDDPYSQLLAQVLPGLRDRYGVEIVAHLVHSPTKENAPEPERLAAFARRDAADVADGYGLRFRDPGEAPPSARVQRAAGQLAAAIQAGRFVECAAAVGFGLWENKESESEGALRAQGLTFASQSTTEGLLARGTARRRSLGHYLGGMSYYGGEWYWGVDRLVHLEERLRSLGAGVAAQWLAPRPPIDPGGACGDERIELEIFPSLRSPYTAIGFEKAIELAREAGVAVRLRPVLPMVMRGVPLTFTKGRYIAMDAHREAELLGVPFGRIHDPIGRPVERAFSLFAWADECGRGAEFIGAFLRAAWAEGRETGSDEGLRAVVETAGLSWQEALGRLEGFEAGAHPAWREDLERNRVAMLDELGLWGVPSFRIRGPQGVPDYSTWGQDRLWRVAEELRARIALLG